MGYRSDVLIAIAFSSVEHRDAVWAVYCIDPRVQEHNLSEVWHKYDKGAYPVLWFSEEYTKWYDSYDEVSGVEYLMDLMSEFAQEKGMPYAYVFYRIGEDTTDIEIIERTAGDNDGGMNHMLWELCSIERRIVHQLTTTHKE
jgi:hypothetical protein